MLRQTHKEVIHYWCPCHEVRVHQVHFELGSDTDPQLIY